MSKTQNLSPPSTPLTMKTLIHRPGLDDEGLQELPSRPMTPMSAETVIHHTPQAPKKPLAIAFNFFKLSVSKSEDDESPKASERILEALSLAGLRKSHKDKKPGKKTYPPPRKLAVAVVDGNSGAIIRADVPVYRLIDISSHAKQVLEANPRAARYKVYGKYKRASVCGVVEAITWLQPIPLHATILMVNLFTYEACLRLGISNNRIELKTLLNTIYKQISSQPLDQEIMKFVVYHLGTDDPVFKHMGHVLCWQRYTRSEMFTEESAKSVATTPAMRKFTAQVDKDKKAQRIANRMWNQAHKQMRSDSDADAEVPDEPSRNREKVAGVDTVETMLDKIAWEK